MIGGNISQVYLTDELKFSKENMSSMQLISAPANILCSVLSGYFSAKKPFTYMFYTSLACICLNSYNVLVLIYRFPRDQTEQQSSFNLGHLAIVNLLQQLADNFWFTTVNAIIMVIADRRIAGIHITMLTSLTNLA